MKENEQTKMLKEEMQAKAIDEEISKEQNADEQTQEEILQEEPMKEEEPKINSNGNEMQTEAPKPTEVSRNKEESQEKQSISTIQPTLTRSSFYNFEKMNQSKKYVALLRPLTGLGDRMRAIILGFFISLLTNRSDIFKNKTTLNFKN